MLLLTLDDGREVIARLPFPMAGPAHLLTASEVATLEFARTVLSLPVPKVLVWSSRADQTPVGAEFMILEKVHGTELAYSWTKIKKDFSKIVMQIGDVEKKLTRTRFAKFGSLYFKDDLEGFPRSDNIFEDPTLETDVTAKFAIGPFTAWELWHGERMQLDVDRGPCKCDYFFPLSVVNF